VVALGSRGDVQPPAELAARLRAAGVDATLFASPDATWIGERRGVPTHPVGPPIAAWFERHPGRSVLDVPFMHRFVGHVADAQTAVALGLARALAGVDVVLGAGFAWGAASAARALGLPYHFVALSPALLPSDAHAPLLYSHADLPRLANRALWWASRRLVAGLVGPPLARAHAALGLPAVADPHAHLLGASALLALDPAIAAPATTAHPVRVIGFLAPRPTPLPDDVVRFLERPAAPPVAYVGFGSMAQRDPRATADLLVAAVRRAGLRVVLQRGWAGLAPSRPDRLVLVVDEVCHATLFSRVAVVVHHGGAGTTHVAARAGAPQVVVPHILDQHAWAARVGRLGVGEALDRRALTVTGLAQRVARATASPIADHARALATALARAPFDVVGPVVELAR